MTSTNRLLNRVILAVLAIAALAGAAYIANRTYPVLAIPTVTELDTTTLWIVAAGSLLVVVLALAVIITRGRGHSRVAVSHQADDGAASIDARVVADLITDDLALVPDVTGVTTRAFRVGGGRALELRVSVRRSSDLRVVVDAVDRAVAELDDVLEERVPILLHVVSGVRANLARRQRVR